MSLESDERETIISWCDSDENDKVFIHTTQRPMLRKLLSNKLFEKTHEIFDEGELVGVDGYLPRKAIAIRKKFRVMSEEQKKSSRERIENYHKRKSKVV